LLLELIELQLELLTLLLQALQPRLALLHLEPLRDQSYHYAEANDDSRATY
jgi:hypothetical protein